MPRPLRIQVGGVAYHVTARGTGPCAIFRDDADRELFLSILERVVAGRRWVWLAYCLMTTHYHLVLQTRTGDLAAGMQQLNGAYAQRFNKRHKRVGHLFQGRYHSVLVESESHLVELLRYVSLNPVRAGSCTTPTEWPWSSYSAAVGSRRGPQLLRTDLVLAFFGTDAAVASERLRGFVENQ